MPLLRQPVRIRWWIFSFLFGFATLSYLQRISLGVAAKEMMPALHLSQMQIAALAWAFTTAYTLAQVPGSVFGQRYGARLTYVVVGIVGLLATLGTPLAPVVLTGAALFVALLLAQAVLGASQGPVFPVFAAVVEVWFPENRWAVANGLQTAGMNIGGAVTAPLITLLTAAFGWQGALVCLAPIAAVLTVGWAWYGRNSPREHPAVTAAELAELPQPDVEVAAPMTMRRLRRIAANRDVLLLAVSYLCMNYAFYLLSFWSYLYLVQVRHFDGVESGLVGGAPWIGAGIGAAAGGYLSDWLAVRLGARWGYRLVPLVTLPIAAALLLLTIKVATPYAAVAALTAAFAAVEMNEGAYWAATMRVARADTGAATGILNTGGNAGGIITHPIVGVLSDAGSWNAAFVTGTVFALIATSLWFWIDSDREARPGSR